MIHTDTLVCANTKIIATRTLPGLKIYQKCFGSLSSAPDPIGELTALSCLDFWGGKMEKKG